MTRWSFRKKPGGIEVAKSSDGLETVNLGVVENLHIALTEVAEHFEEGDLVSTPEGPYIVHPPTGELNN
jgi:hypothetical protein